jgi:hypothetical protein
MKVKIGKLFFGVDNFAGPSLATMTNILLISNITKLIYNFLNRKNNCQTIEVKEFHLIAFKGMLLKKDG